MSPDFERPYMTERRRVEYYRRPHTSPHEPAVSTSTAPTESRRRPSDPMCFTYSSRRAEIVDSSLGTKVASRGSIPRNRFGADLYSSYPLSPRFRRCRQAPCDEPAIFHPPRNSFPIGLSGEFRGTSHWDIHFDSKNRELSATSRRGSWIGCLIVRYSVTCCSRWRESSD
jgi:hypothetical protein